MRWFVVVVFLGAPLSARAQVWQDATADCLGTTSQWSNKVEVADIDGDGQIDMLVANGGGYASPGTPEATRVWRNLGNWSTAAPHCTEVSGQAVGGFTGLSRMIKAADIDGDGDLDILTGGAYQTQLKLFVRGASGWTDESSRLPQQPTSVGDAELGDVDGDGDLDIVLADWGTTNPNVTGYPGGRTRLYLNDGTGHFTEATATNMPDILVKWSWDLELADVDGDFDLDVLVSCKLCTTSYLFRNNGSGMFTDDPAALPHYSNNYELEPMDIDGDGDLDLITINDGPNVTEHIFVNRGDGTFADETSTRLIGTANPANADDNVAVWLDYNSDGAADLLIGTLGNDRLLENDGTGKFTLVANATPNDTNATLGLAVADFNGDGRIDVLQGQGEVQSSLPEKLQLATATVLVDTKEPSLAIDPVVSDHVIRARVHDYVGPSHPHDFQSVVVMVGSKEIPMQWYGGMLWRAALPLELGTPTTFSVCARDRRGNLGCAEAHPTDGDGGFHGDDTLTNPNPPGGCCDASRDPSGSFALAALCGTMLARRGRSRRRGPARM